MKEYLYFTKPLNTCRSGNSFIIFLFRNIFHCENIIYELNLQSIVNKLIFRNLSIAIFIQSIKNILKKIFILSFIVQTLIHLDTIANIFLIKWIFCELQQAHNKLLDLFNVNCSPAIFIKNIENPTRNIDRSMQLPFKLTLNFFMEVTKWSHANYILQGKLPTFAINCFVFAKIILIVNCRDLSLSSGLFRFVQFNARVNSRKSRDPLPSSSNTLKIDFLDNFSLLLTVTFT